MTKKTATQTKSAKLTIIKRLLNAKINTENEETAIFENKETERLQLENDWAIFEENNFCRKITALLGWTAENDFWVNEWSSNNILWENF